MWEKLVNRTGQALLPCYRKFLRKMIDCEADVSTDSLARTNALLSNMKTLIELGNPDDGVLLSKAQSKQLYFSERDDCMVTEAELKPLRNTLNMWIELKDELERAKTGDRGIVSSTEQEKNPLVTRLKAQSIARISCELELDAENGTHPAEESGVPEELVTSFQEPAPRTFKVCHPTKPHSPRSAPGTPERSKRALFATSRQSHAAVDTRDLMTQITTPFTPVLVRCPSCSHPYEIEVYGGAFEKPTPDWEQGSRSSSVLSPVIPELSQSGRDRTKPLPESVFTMIPASDSGMSTYTGTRSKPAKDRRKLFHMLRKSSPSLTRADTADSSGIGSSPDPIAMEHGGRTQGKREPRAKSKDSSSRHSFFHWGKRSKSRVPDKNETTTIEPAQSESYPSLKSTDQSNFPQSILRSRSWVQQGTPWGHGPVLHDQLEQQTSHMTREVSQSERILLHRSRPQITEQSFRKTVCPDNLLPGPADIQSRDTNDSGVQTNFELWSSAGIPESVQVSIDAAGLHSESGPSSNSNKTTTGYSVTKESSSLSKSPRRGLTTPCPSDQTHPGNETSALETWEVSCQVGVINREHGVSVDLYESGTPIALKCDAVSVAHAQPKACSSTQTAHDIPPSFPVGKQSVLECFSVACQVGPVLEHSALEVRGPEKVPLLDRTSSRLATECPPATNQHSGMIGKKLQVGAPWWQVTSASVLDTVMAPAKKLVDTWSQTLADTCPPACGTNEMAKKPAFSVSTLVGRVSTPAAQQTEPVSSTLLINNEAVHIQAVKPVQISVSTCASGPTQASVTTQIGSVEQTVPRAELIEPSSLVHCKVDAPSETLQSTPTVEANQDSDHLVNVTPVPDSRVCPHCGQNNKPKVQTRSKRIQKGQPALGQLIETGQGSVATTGMVINETTSVTNTHSGAQPDPPVAAKRRHPARKQLVVDIGVYHDEVERKRLPSWRRRSNKSAANRHRHRTVGRAVSSNNDSTSSTLSPSDSLDSVRLLFRLDPEATWHTVRSRKPPRRHEDRGRSPRSFSVDGLSGALSTVHARQERDG